MTVKRLLKPGTLVTCRAEADGLIMWSSYGCHIDHDIDHVNENDILMVLKSRKPTKIELNDIKNPLTEEWIIGSYQVLSPKGIKGWVGAGWVLPITI